jgi:hypothetical protein
MNPMDILRDYQHESNQEAPSTQLGAPITSRVTRPGTTTIRCPV